MNYENIEKESDKRIIYPEIQLKEADFGVGFPKGSSGEKRPGFSFFELREVENKDGSISQVWEFITSQLTESPVLSAVTDKQYKRWKKKTIKAVPVEFIWDEKTTLWKVQEDNLKK